MTRDEWDSYCGWREAFAEVIDQAYYPLEWLDGLLLSGRAFFISTPTAAAVYEFKQYPSGAMDLHGLVCAGDLDSIVHDIIPETERIGHAHGCLCLLIESRPGWVKAMRGSGYELHQCSIRKQLA